MPVLSMVFEQFVSVQLGRFMERSSVLLSTQLTSRKGLGTCDALLCVFHTIQSALESGQETRIVQIDISAAFDRVNHQCLKAVFMARYYPPVNLGAFLNPRKQDVWLC